MNSKRQEELFNEFSEEQRKTLIKKRSDYATEEVLSNFIQTANITGTSPAQVALMLIGIKVARLGNLISNNKTNVNESMEDSVLDLANYAFLLKCILVDNNESVLKDVIQENNPIVDGKWVECIEQICHSNSLTIGKKYKVIKEEGEYYHIINNLDKGEVYFKWRFKEVMNNTVNENKKIKCINNLGWIGITENKIYEVKKEKLLYYLIVNDFDNEDYYPKRNFEVVDTNTLKTKLKGG